MSWSRTEMAHVIFGIDKMDKAEVYKTAGRLSLSRQSMRSTMGALIQDRKELGLVLSLSVQTI